VPHDLTLKNLMNFHLRIAAETK